MNVTDYKIDASTVDEKLFDATTRTMWEEEKRQLQDEIYSSFPLHSMTVEMREKMMDEITAARERIAYIDEVLHRWYSDMCIRCGKLTPVDTYCGKPNNCQHCLRNWINHALSTLTDEDLERIEKRLASEGEEPDGC